MFNQQVYKSVNAELKTEISDFEKDIELIMNGEKSLSYSSLSSFIKSPKHFYEYKTGVKETTKAMLEGQIFHMACLEPERFNEKYWVLDDTEKCEEIGGAKPRSTKVYKEWVKTQDLLHNKQERISKDDFDTFTSMSESLRKNKASKALMNNLTSTEEPFEIMIDGFNFKGKIDGVGVIEDDKSNMLGLNKGDKYLIDLKKAADSSFDKIKWDIIKMNYHLQAGLYSAAKRIKIYFLVYVDKSCNITVVKLSPETLEDGYTKLEFTIQEFVRCAEENSWYSSYEFSNGGYINY